MREGKVQPLQKFPDLPRLVLTVMKVSHPGPQLEASDVISNLTPCFHLGHLGGSGSKSVYVDFVVSDRLFVLFLLFCLLCFFVCCCCCFLPH